MSVLHDFLPEPRLHEDDWVTTCASADHAFERAKHYDLASSPLVAALFWLRTLPERIARADVPPPDLHVDAIGSSGAGFFVLYEDSQQLIVGAVGRFWETEITFAHLRPDEFARFAEPGWGKVAWALRSDPAPGGSRLSLEVAVTATDDASWKRQQRYFRLIGPFSRFIRRHELAMIARELGGELEIDAQRPLPGDAFIPQPKAAATNVVIIDAPPTAVWPWLVQMGRGRAGWYSHDLLDNGAIPSAIAIIPELQELAVGDILPTGASKDVGFTVLALEQPRALVLGTLVDRMNGTSLPIAAEKPNRYWQSSWAFVLEPVEGGRTRLCVRARIDYAPDTLSARMRLHALAVIHRFMESEQLKNLKLRAEARAPLVATSSLLSAIDATVGAAVIAFDLATPFLRGVRSHWVSRASRHRSAIRVMS